MAATDISPNVDNYYLGTGIMWWRPKLPDGTLAAWRDLGNVPEFTFESTVETKEHNTSRHASRGVDKTVMISNKGEARIILEEWTAPNLSMWLLGTVTGADETASINIGAVTVIDGQLAFVGTNDVGPRWNIWLPNTSFRPSGSLNPLNDDWGAMELIGGVALQTVGEVTRFGVASRADIAEAELPAWGFVAP